MRTSGLIGRKVIMPTPQAGSSSARALPARPNLEHLKNEAKQRLDALRHANPSAKLAKAQFQLAREHGFASWRELKAEVERRAGPAAPPDAGIVGDWIRAEGDDPPRVALHVRRLPGGGLSATSDSPDFNLFDLPIDTIEADAERLRFIGATAQASLLYEARWDEAAQAWRGRMQVNGIEREVAYVRGVYPPKPTFHGLDGVWDGRIEAKEMPRITIRVRTDMRGTLGWCDSPDRSGTNMPVRAIRLEGRRVVFDMQLARFEGELDEAGEAIEARFIRGDTKSRIRLVRRAPGAPAPFDPDEIAVAPEVLARYAGTYVSPAGVKTRVFVEDGGLQLIGDMPGQPPLKLGAISETEFFYRAMDARLRFELDDAGAVAGLVVHFQGREAASARLE
jgi:hypothetical protein